MKKKTKKTAKRARRLSGKRLEQVKALRPGCLPTPAPPAPIPIPYPNIGG